MAFQGKIQLFYQSPPNTGFSEVWYVTSPDHESTMTQAKNYLTKRKQLLGFQAYCVGIRVSDDTVKGDSLVYVPTDKEAKSTLYTGLADVADKSGVSAQVRVASGFFHRRQWMLRGAPDALFDAQFPTGIDIGFHGWLAAFQALALILEGGAFAIRYITAVGPPVVHSLAQVTKMQLIRAAFRKPGRPFGLARGRRNS